jgi:hypothetical protein
MCATWEVWRACRIYSRRGCFGQSAFVIIDNFFFPDFTTKFRQAWFWTWVWGLWWIFPHGPQYVPQVPNVFPIVTHFYPISFALSFILCNLYSQPKNAYFGTFQCFITFLCDAHHKRKPIEPKFEILVFPKVPHNILISFLNFQMGSQSVPQHVLKTNVMRI